MTTKDKPFRPKSLLLVLIAAGFLGACSRDDSPEKIVEPTNAAPAPSTSSEASRDQAKMVAGEISIVTGKNAEKDEFQALSLGGRAIYEGQRYLNILKTFDFPGKTIVLLSDSGGGSCCPADCVLVTIHQDGKATHTERFGNCEALPKLSVKQEEITITSTDLRGQGNEVWKYANDVLTQTQHIDPNVEANATKIDMNDRNIARIKGTLGPLTVTDSDGNRIETDIDILKLPNKSLIPNCVFHDALIDSIRINKGVNLPKVKGESEFDVKLDCPDAGPSISAIRVAGTSNGQLDEPPGGDRNAAQHRNSSGSASGGDRVADYANYVASHMEGASHPACHALASSIRTLGNSGGPDFVRERQVDAIVNKAPSFCFRR